MADLIDRQAALEAFEWADADVCEADEFGSSWGFGHKNIKDVLNKLPTIDPESLRPKGEWIWDEENECWVCSNCKLSALNNYRGNSTESNFCPRCGADMRGDSK